MRTRDKTTYNLQAEENISGKEDLTRHEQRDPHLRHLAPLHVLQKKNSCS